ncbi:MAG: alpha/beta hydrolase [Gammaproteobacteria bacterium]
MASPQSESIKNLYAGWLSAMGENPNMELDEVRALFETWGDITGEPGGVDYIEETCNGIPCMWAKPKGASESHVLLCTHGGGYVTGSMYTHRKMFGHLAKATGCQALIVHYNRAPENPHPGPVNECTDVYAWLLDQGFKPENILTTGDSAGGALSLTVVLNARERGLPMPAGIMPMSPWVDMEVNGETLESRASTDALVQKAVVENMSTTFLGDASPQDPLANPLYADLGGLPPMYIQVGDHETLLDNSTRLEERAKSAGVDVKLDNFPEMQHVFQFMAGMAPEADDAVQRMAAWAKSRLGL